VSTREMMTRLMKSRGDIDRMPTEAEVEAHDDRQHARLKEIIRGVDHSTEFRMLVGIWLDTKTGSLNLTESLGGDQASAEFLELPVERLLLVPTEELAGLRRKHAEMSEHRVEMPYRMEFCIWLRNEAMLGDELFRGAWLSGLRYTYCEGDCWSLWFDGLVLRRRVSEIKETES